MAYLGDDSQVLSDLAAILKDVSAAILITEYPWWPGVVSLAHAQAYADIVQALATRGFTAPQIAAWDNGPIYERTIAVCYALSYNAVLSEAGAKFIEKGERYLENLKSVVLVSSTVVADPLGPVGLPNSGPMSRQNLGLPPGECWGPGGLGGIGDNYGGHYGGRED